MMWPFIFVAFIIYIIIYITIKVSKSRKDAENERDAEAQRNDRFRLDGQSNVAPAQQRSVRQTFIINPVYTIEANREPVPYEAALAMPRTTTRSIEITNKSYDDDLPSYDQAIIFSNSTVPVPAPATNDAVR